MQGSCARISRVSFFLEPFRRSLYRLMIGAGKYIHALQIMDYALRVIAWEHSPIEPIPPVSIDEPLGFFFIAPSIGRRP